MNQGANISASVSKTLPLVAASSFARALHKPLLMDSTPLIERDLSLFALKAHFNTPGPATTDGGHRRNNDRRECTVCLIWRENHARPCLGRLRPRGRIKTDEMHIESRHHHFHSSASNLFSLPEAPPSRHQQQPIGKPSPMTGAAWVWASAKLHFWRVQRSRHTAMTR